MHTLVSSSLVAALLLINAGAAVARAPTSDAYLALASCPGQAADGAPGEPNQIVEDKGSTAAALILLKEYLEFHGEAQGGVGARAALMPWSDLATHAN
jgi:hypothetical protein